MADRSHSGRLAPREGGRGLRVALVSVCGHGGLVPLPPMGLGYLAAVLRRAGHVPSVFDTAIDPLWRSDLAEFGPQFVGFGALSSAAQALASLARQVKAVHGCPVVVGGAHASLAPTEILDGCADVDYVLPGEAEETLPKLVECVVSGNSVRSVPSLLCRAHGELVCASGPELVRDLDALPLPAWDLLRPERYGMAPIVCSPTPRSS
jgi:anaerobic magnesium-protoporphyrin IX monomethyl ester cyclase